MPYIRPLEKPEIWLVGEAEEANGLLGNFCGRVDHSIKSYTYATNVIEAEETMYVQNQEITFQDSVRIIITPRGVPKTTYANQIKSFSPQEFEGNHSYDTEPGVANALPSPAEVYYTLNGADPRRQKQHLYNYLDLDSRVVTDNSESPSAVMTHGSDNINTLGFVLGAAQTGSGSITLKARTFYNGQVSPIAIARFKIARRDPLQIFV